MENEIELIKGCRAGKDSAGRNLHPLFQTRCWRYVSAIRAIWKRRTMYCMTVSSMIFNQLFRFRGESSLCTWITRVMVTQSLDFLATGEASQPVGSAWRAASRYTGYIGFGRRGWNLRRAVDGFYCRIAGWLTEPFLTFMCLKRNQHKEIAKMLHIKEHSSTSQLHRAKYFVSKKN